MPNYIYIDPKTGEEREVTHPMNESPKIISKKGNVMHKKPCAPILSGFDKFGSST